MVETRVVLSVYGEREYAFFVLVEAKLQSRAHYVSLFSLQTQWLLKLKMEVLLGMRRVSSC